MVDLSDGSWTLAFQRNFEMAPVPGRPGNFYSIPGDAFPSQNDFTLTAPWVAIATTSQATQSSYWKGCYARIQVLLPNLGPEAIGVAITIPVNRGARLIEVPSWAVEGYQIKLEFPQWLEQIRVEIYLYAPP